MNVQIQLRILTVLSITVFLPVADLSAIDPADQKLLLSAKRLLLDDKMRAAEVLIVNPSSEKVSYKISLIDMRMAEDGHLERLALDALPPSSLKPAARFAPNQVTLDPGATQRVRIAVSASISLPPGEYRSHLQVEALPKAQKSAPVDNQGISIRFQFVPAISIPIIYRTGNPTASASISDATYSNRHVSFLLNRSGSRSIRGDINLYFQSSDGKKKSTLVTVRDVAVYCPNAYRKMNLTLSDAVPLPPGPGKFVVEFSETGTKNGVRCGASIVAGG